MPRQIIANTAAIATGHPYGAAAGIEMLRHGGNAIDAAVAAMLALSVVIPGSVGLGGYGGSAVIQIAGSHPEGTRRGAGSRRKVTGSRQLASNGPSPTVTAVDFDSRAPLGWREGVVTADPQSSYYGARAVTVPGVVAGLDQILREFGTKSWSEVSQPAILLAKDGFEFDAEHQRHFNRCAAKFDRQSVSSLFPGGAPPGIGDRWRQPQLAKLLERLAAEGPLSFYDGEIAHAIVRYLDQRGGILTEQDFCSYRPQIVQPLHVACRGFDFYTPPPPSGGVTTLEIVRTVELYLTASSMAPWSAAYFHVLAETMKLAWHERQGALGDPDFVSIPIDEMLSEGAAAERVEQIRARWKALSEDTGQKQDNLGPPSPPGTPWVAPGHDSPHTANVIAMDADGNLISITATQGWMYGSHLVVDGLGLVLNHGMSRFDYSPGHANAPAPGKRMLHNMAPMIVLRKDRPAFALGMPGGAKIVSVTAQLALNAIAFGATPAASIAAPRVHTDGSEPLLVSSHMPARVVADLETLGHVIRREEDMGGPVNVLAADSQSGKIDIASGESTGAVAGF
ncbi:MAG TPA: gamma-glutamyltransferase [Lacipirellulaceae bacterium]|nr:gamma-glutamyltransferase [Lacipirellulaceae bacterium]